MLEIVPEPALHSAQIISAFRRNVFEHYEEVDRALFMAFRVLFGLYQGSTRPTKVTCDLIARLPEIVPETMPK